ncbi:Translation factor GUF1-like protein, mitochondrial [Aphelenchoides fujianensis]|nr:Translation factor GUF1-like protein, mitochondrial [Aphelenchoides fujianensis]KAI6222344.1 Translation factor GUF1-like protein, mitochondrial [Aphelenchoides fujianensis]
MSYIAIEECKQSMDWTRRLRLCRRVAAIPGGKLRRLSTASGRFASFKVAELEDFPHEKIRNFSIVAHVDHGKSTLADRLLQLAGVIDRRERAQFLDNLQVERDRGITVKAQTCTFMHKGHLVNLIDTPGHADFSFEVSRSLAACNGMVLLVAANQGVQAQTLANFWLGFELDLFMIPVINKIDLPGADVPAVTQQLHQLFGFDEKEVLQISAKSGLNVEHLLDTIVEKIPPPKVQPDRPFKALIFDSWFDHFRGAIALVLVTEGRLKVGQKIRSFNNDAEYDVVEVGLKSPGMVPTKVLNAGQVGYVLCQMKTVKEAQVGETLFDASLKKEEVSPFPGFKLTKPSVYAGFFPLNPSEYEGLRQALDRLILNDPSVVLKPDSSSFLGLGFKLGFLGMLHMDVFAQRLEQEYGANLVVTAPSVEYLCRIKDNESIRKRRYDGKAEFHFSDPAHFPHPMDVEAFLEPVINLTIITNNDLLNAVNSLCTGARGERGDVTSIDESRLLIKWRLPLAEVVSGFFDELKRVTSGFVSFDYEHCGHEEVDLVVINVTVNDRLISEFSTICPTSRMRQKAKSLVHKLQELIPRQQYEVKIKATSGESSKALSQATIRAYKKDFSQLLKGNFGGGGMERLNKKLSHQKKGKEQLKTIGNIQIPKEVFLNVVRDTQFGD